MYRSRVVGGCTQGAVPGPGSPPGYTIPAPASQLVLVLHQRCRGCAGRTAWAQRCPRAWVIHPAHTTLPRVVTILREVAGRREAGEGAESGNDQIADGHSGP